MRQAEEGDVDAVPVERFDRLEVRQRGSAGDAGQVRKDLAQSLPGLAVGGHGDDVDRRMVDQQPHQFGAGVTAGADHGDADAVVGEMLVWS